MLIVITVVCLVWATIEDVRKRIVPDKIWLIQICCSIPFLVIWYINNNNFIARVIVLSNIILGFIIAIVFLYAGGWGGGDSKGLIAISISSPISFSLWSPKLSVAIVPPIFYFMVNLFLCFLSLALIFLVQNFYSIREFGPLFSETNGKFGSKISILLSGRRIAREKVENLKFEDPAEIFDGAWYLYTPLFEEVLDDEEYQIKEKEARDKAWSHISQSNRSYLWTRPQPPGLLLFLIAYVCLILVGSPGELFF